MSKSTTKKELVKIHGIEDYTAKMQGLNLNAGQTNALEFCQTMYNMPKLEELLELFNSTE